jgi:hypothetical protein
MTPEALKGLKDLITYKYIYIIKLATAQQYFSSFGSTAQFRPWPPP